MIPQRIVSFFTGVAWKLLAHDRSCDDVESLQRHHRAQVRGIHFLPDSRSLPREQRGQHSVGQHDRAHLICDAAVDVGGRRAPASDRVHDSGPCLPKIIERRLAAVRSVRAVARRARIDDSRIQRCQFRVSEPEPLRDALAKVLHENIAAGSQSMHNFTRLGLPSGSARYFSCACCWPRSNSCARFCWSHCPRSRRYPVPDRLARAPLF